MSNPKAYNWNVTFETLGVEKGTLQGGALEVFAEFFQLVHDLNSAQIVPASIGLGGVGTGSVTKMQPSFLEIVR